MRIEAVVIQRCFWRCFRSYFVDEKVRLKRVGIHDVRSNFCWWKESIMGNASRVWGVHCPGWGVDCRPLRKMRWYDFAKVQNALFCMFHVQDTQPVEIALIWRGMSGKDERKDVLISSSSFPSGCYWLIMGLDWSPPSALTLGGSKIITKMRKTGIFKMQP